MIQEHHYLDGNAHSKVQIYSQKRLGTDISGFAL